MDSEYSSITVRMEYIVDINTKSEIKCTIKKYVFLLNGYCYQMEQVAFRKEVYGFCWIT